MGLEAQAATQQNFFLQTFLFFMKPEAKPSAIASSSSPVSRACNCNGYGARSSLTESAADEMISSQMPLKEKIARADHVVWNNGPPQTLGRQAEMLARTWRATQ